MALPAKKARYTFADCLVWDESERIEIINGQAFLMATPSRMHQEISMAIAAQLYNFLEGKRCRVYPAPFGVRLFEEEGDAPENGTVQVMLLDGGMLRLHEVYGRSDVAKVNILSGCFIELARVFPE